MTFAGAAASNLGANVVLAIAAIWTIAGAVAALTIPCLRRLPPLPAETPG